MQRKSTPKEKGPVTVRGVVAPTEWDMRDEVVAVTLYGHDDSEYIVNNRAMVRRLMKHMDEEVEAHGVLTEDEYGNEVLEATDFTPVEVDADDEGDEDELAEEDLDDAPLDDWDDEEGEDSEGEEEDEGYGDGGADWDTHEGAGHKRRRSR